MWPVNVKVIAIQRYPVPTTKWVDAFLGHGGLLHRYSQLEFLDCCCSPNRFIKSQSQVQLVRVMSTSIWRCKNCLMFSSWQVWQYLTWAICLGSRWMPVMWGQWGVVSGWWLWGWHPPQTPMSFVKKINSHQLNCCYREGDPEVCVDSSGLLIVHTDHNLLTFLCSLASLNHRLVRWIWFLHFV